MVFFMAAPTFKKAVGLLTDRLYAVTHPKHSIGKLGGKKVRYITTTPSAFYTKNFKEFTRKFESVKPEFKELISRAARQKGSAKLRRETDILMKQIMRNRSIPKEDTPSYDQKVDHRHEVEHALAEHYKDDYAKHIRQMRAVLLSENKPEEALEAVKKCFAPPKKSLAKPQTTKSMDVKALEKSAETVALENREMVRRQNEISAEIKNALLDGRTNDKKLENLEKFVYESSVGGSKGVTGLERFNSNELLEIFQTFWDLEGYDQVVELVLEAEDPHFVNSPFVMEYMIRSMFKGNYFNPHIILAMTDIMKERDPTSTTPDVIKGEVYTKNYTVAKRVVINEVTGHRNSKVLEEYRTIFPKAEGKLGDEASKNCTDSLSKAISYLKFVFKKDWDPRVGCKVMHRQLEFGARDEAAVTAEYILLACKRDGGLNSNNFMIIRSMLEAAYASTNNKALIPLLEQELLRLCNSSKKVESVLVSLKDLAQTISNRGIKEMIDSLEERLVKLNLNSGARVSIVPSINPKDPRSTLTKSMEAATYSYKGRNSHSVQGNFRFGAQLPDQNINRKDLVFFERVLELPLSVIFNEVDEAKIPESIKKFNLEQTNLNDILEFDDFNAACDLLIRTRFDSAELQLERLDSKGHKKFDETVSAFTALSAGGPTASHRKNLRDSRTNLSKRFELGLGDCRHFTQIKQILFDLWQNKKLNMILSAITEKHDETGEFDKGLVELFDEVNATTLRTIDFEVHLPVELNKDGQPVFEGNHFLHAATRRRRKIEEHTANILFTYGVDGEIKKSSLADSFYQNTYPWKHQTLSAWGDDFLVHGARAGSVKVVSEDGELIHTPVMIKPTTYAGDRARHQLENDSLRFLGLPADDIDSITRVINNEKQRKQLHAEVLKWYQANKKKVR